MSGHAPEGPPRRVVGIGASAGGVDALVRLVRHLPADLPAAVAEHRALLMAGRVYVAPPDSHVTVVVGRVCPDHGPNENATRPAVDPLLRSLATGHGRLAVGVNLSGAGRATGDDVRMTAERDG